MSIPAINWAIEQKDLPPGEWVVLFHLAHCHNHETGRCDPSQDYLSHMTNMGVRTVRRHLSNLETKGRIARKKRGVEGGGRVSDCYALGFETAKMAGYVTGQSVSANRPIHVENVHEMAGKQEEQEEQEVPPIGPPPKKPLPKAWLPETWVPSSDAIAFAQRKGLHQSEIEELADDFRSYWTDRTDRGARKSERGWEQTWRNRVNDRLATILRNRSMAGGAGSGGFGQGRSLASVAARRAADGQI